MLELKNWKVEAEKKLTEGKKLVKGQKERVMADSVARALMSFCVQEEEFAQAVDQGGTFPECMEALARGTGTSISDLEAYKKAVKFYFPGAEIHMQMTIDLVGAADASDQTETPASLTLNLEDFF